jgi:HAD superfamily hydrolase (TIGR01549 family)
VARVGAGGVVFVEVEAIVFDKDGTLVDLDASWSQAGRVWLERSAAGDGDLFHRLCQALGYDPIPGSLVPDGVLAAATVGVLADTTRAVLAEAGVSADKIERRVGDARREALAVASTMDRLRAIGDVHATFRRLAEAGLRLAVATSDDRRVAEPTLAHLGVASLVGALVCGDDGFPPKPDPAGLLAISATLSVEPGRLLMVGDSTGDLEAARAAGTAGVVAVGRRSPAAAGADAVVESIEELAVMPGGVTRRRSTGRSRWAGRAP